MTRQIWIWSDQIRSDQCDIVMHTEADEPKAMSPRGKQMVRNAEAFDKKSRAIKRDANFAHCQFLQVHPMDPAYDSKRSLNTRPISSRYDFMRIIGLCLLLYPSG
jgi:hypothetical protein